MDWFWWRVRLKAQILKALSTLGTFHGMCPGGYCSMYFLWGYWVCSYHMTYKLNSKEAVLVYGDETYLNQTFGGETNFVFGSEKLNWKNNAFRTICLFGKKWLTLIEWHSLNNSFRIICFQENIFVGVKQISNESKYHHSCFVEER